MKALGNVFRGIKLTITAVALAAVGLFIGAGAIHHYTTATPSVQKAPYLIQSSSLVYYCDRICYRFPVSITFSFFLFICPM